MKRPSNLSINSFATCPRPFRYWKKQRDQKEDARFNLVFGVLCGFVIGFAILVMVAMLSSGCTHFSNEVETIVELAAERVGVYVCEHNPDLAEKMRTVGQKLVMEPSDKALMDSLINLLVLSANEDIVEDVARVLNARDNVEVVVRALLKGLSVTPVSQT